MMKRWMEQLSAALSVEDSTPSKVDVERVSALLLVEIARSDHSIDERERQTIIDALCQASSSARSEIEQIVDEALTDADAVVTLHAHISVVNDHFELAEKIQLIEHMWRVAMADGDLDKYEEYTIRKLADLLYIKHRDFLQAKLRVIDDA